MTGAATTARDPPATGLLAPDVRPKVHRPHARFTRYATDQTDRIDYCLNAFGYRGENPDPKAAFQFCVIGESHAFGVGVPQEQTFCHRLKLHIASALGLAPQAVNAVNLALGGQSADYCLRTAYRQVPRLPALDLLVCFVPFPERIEYHWPHLGYRSLDVASLTEAKLDAAPTQLLAFADLYSDRMGRIWLLKNMLLLQQFCRARGLDLVMADQHLTPRLRKQDQMAIYDRLLDETGILRSQLFDLRPDKAVDRTHGGPRTHAAFAIALLGRYAQLLARRGNTRRARKLAEHATALRQSDPDWLFCQQEMQHLRAIRRQDVDPQDRRPDR